MKFYKLIKEYPGSPKLGTTSVPNGFGVIAPNFSESDYEKFTDYWKMFERKDFEVLEFYNPDNKNVYYKDYNDSYHTKDSKGHLHSCGGRYFDYCIKYYNIHSIKRNSDGEVFTVGDDVLLNIIKSTETIDKITFGVESGLSFHCGDYIANTVSLNKVSDKVLLTTQDGVDVVDKDTVVYVPQKHYRSGFDDYVGVSDILSFTAGDFIGQRNVAVFSAKEVAIEFVKSNKCFLSLNEVMDAYYDTKEGSDFKKKLKDMIGGKIW